MTISLSDAGKRFNRDWIFRRLTCEFQTGTAYAVTGPNGSGKSTLLQVISGAMDLSEGSLQYELQGKKHKAPSDEIYKHVSVTAPYLEVVEEMTLMEFLTFHQKFKPFVSSLSVKEIINNIGLEKSANKQIRYYSSGMKQRVKLAQCILSDTSLVLLDEPCTNLDAEGIALYHQLIEKYCKDRLVIVSSNDEVEYKFCTEIISIADYK
jgi:ABC-type multidrug transport system ATPase subunit